MTVCWEFHIEKGSAFERHKSLPVNQILHLMFKGKSVIYAGILFYILIMHTMATFAGLNNFQNKYFHVNRESKNRKWLF